MNNLNYHIDCELFLVCVCTCLLAYHFIYIRYDEKLIFTIKKYTGNSTRDNSLWV